MLLRKYHLKTPPKKNIYIYITDAYFDGSTECLLKNNSILLAVAHMYKPKGLNS